VSELIQKIEEAKLDASQKKELLWDIQLKYESGSSAYKKANEALRSLMENKPQITKSKKWWLFRKKKNRRTNN
jgi:ABC-type antimicrobial peptide transport system ATPase subunit